MRTVSVDKNNLLGCHVDNGWIRGRKAVRCKGFKTEARWVEKHKLSAMGRNRQGVCMACGETETNRECPQCCREKRWENNK